MEHNILKNIVYELALSQCFSFLLFENLENRTQKIVLTPFGFQGAENWNIRAE